jgi:hypothetical protein
MSARLSVPSYVIPGGYAENLRFLYERTSQRQVELLFFIYDDDTRAILRDEGTEIESFSADFGFTVHMPDAIEPRHEELLERTAGYASAFIIHPPRDDGGLPAFATLLDEWRCRYGPDRFLLENTTLARFDAADAATAGSRHGPPRICADIGHLRVEGRDPAAWVAERADRVGELHVHGFDGSRDHIGFTAGEPWITELAPFARGFDGVVELELFSWAEAEAGSDVLRDAWGAL